MYGAKRFFLSTYMLSTNRPNVGKDIAVRKDADFDGAWTWLYFAYSPSEQKTFAYMRFASEKVYAK